MQDNARLNADVHLRVPSDFIPQVHLVARQHGMTAAHFMRKAITDALVRLGAETVAERDTA